MIYYLANILKCDYSICNLFHYVSVRAIASLLTTLLCSLIFGQKFIDKSKIWFRSKAREWTPERHKQKDNMPTMGGIFILCVVLLNALFWADINDPLVWIFLTGMIGFGAIGAWDDWSKIKYHKGISARLKFIAQIGVATIITCWLVYVTSNTTVVLPFFKTIQPNLGFLFIPWAIFVIIAMCNAVNLTDGLDGLAIGSLIPNFSTFGALCYCAGHYKLAQYLNIPFTGTAEIAVLSAILVGASLGFLWYNTYPAQIFMGDVGSLALGACLALMALMAKQELLLPIAGFLFVVETVSVILQVFAVKFYKRRLFKMAPIHHHFELLGWQESKITVRFGIISLVVCLLALVTLKMR